MRQEEEDGEAKLILTKFQECFILWNGGGFLDGCYRGKELKGKTCLMSNTYSPRRTGETLCDPLLTISKQEMPLLLWKTPDFIEKFKTYEQQWIVKGSERLNVGKHAIDTVYFASCLKQISHYKTRSSTV